MRPEVTNRPAALSRRGLIRLGLGAGLALALSVPARAQQASTPDTAPFALISATEAYEAAGSGEIILVDIRTPEEWAETGIPEGAVALDMRAADFVQNLVALRVAYRDRPIAFICRTGNRSQFLTATLAGQGFPGLLDVSEGIAGGPRGKGWLREGLPVYAGTPENIAARLAQVMPAPE